VQAGWGSIGHMQAIRIDPKIGVMTAGADPRRTGYAIGWPGDGVAVLSAQVTASANARVLVSIPASESAKSLAAGADAVEHGRRLWYSGAVVPRLGRAEVDATGPAHDGLTVAE